MSTTTPSSPGLTVMSQTATGGTSGSAAAISSSPSTGGALVPSAVAQVGCALGVGALIAFGLGRLA
jgi:hypothetical protein